LARCLKVIEMGGYAAGYAGRLFVRDGADVVRVEPTVEKPSWASYEAMETYLHAGKRRVARVSERVLADLIQAADVVVCEVDSAQQYDGFASMCKGKRHVVISPFGLTGPKQNWQATPSTLLAMGGYTQIMGDADKAPLTLPGHYLEFQSGTLAYGAVQVSVLEDRRDLIDIGMFETLMSLSQFTTVRWHCAGQIRSRHGSDFWFVSPSELFKCADGWVYINIVPNFWDPFLALIELPELVIDERFQTNDGRMLYREALLSAIAGAFKLLTKAEIEQRAEQCRVPLGVVRTLDDVLAEPHLLERGFWEEITSSAGGKVQSPGLPYRTSDEPRAGWAVQAAEAVDV
jgi:crotonobetainyl-CoA:carnitine CoA-transferase CaiB-like acyl-CoA transferase